MKMGHTDIIILSLDANVCIVYAGYMRLACLHMLVGVWALSIRLMVIVGCSVLLSGKISLRTDPREAARLCECPSSVDALSPALQFVKGFLGRRSTFHEIVREAVSPELRDSVVNKIVSIDYPDGQLPLGKHLPSVKALLLELGACRLSIAAWPALRGDIITRTEGRRFANKANAISLKDVHFDPSQVRSYRQTGYDRSSGNIVVRAILKVRHGWKGIFSKTYYLEMGGASSSDLDATKKLIPSYEDLKTDPTQIQVSMGNFVDHYGFFILRPDKWGRWIYTGPIDESWGRDVYRVLVEFENGRHEVGEIRPDRMPGRNVIRSVYFRSADKKMEYQLASNGVRFILSTYTFGWGNAGPLLEPESVQGQSMAANYDRASDLRHLFALPYIDNDLVFNDQLAASSEQLEAAKQDAVMRFELRKRTGESLSPDIVRKALVSLGYTEVSGVFQIKTRGEFALEPAHIAICLRSARYPLNALVVGIDGQLALFHISGASGRAGANYWTVYSWIANQIESRFGWKPFTLLALDNGMDPTWNFYDRHKLIWQPVKGGRPRANGSLLIEQALAAPSIEAFHTTKNSTAARLIRQIPHPDNEILEAIYRYDFWKVKNAFFWRGRLDAFEKLNWLPTPLEELQLSDLIFVWDHVKLSVYKIVEHHRDGITLEDMATGEQRPGSDVLFPGSYRAISDHEIKAMQAKIPEEDILLNWLIFRFDHYLRTEGDFVARDAKLLLDVYRNVYDAGDGGLIQNYRYNIPPHADLVDVLGFLTNRLNFPTAINFMRPITQKAWEMLMQQEESAKAIMVKDAPGLLSPATFVQTIPAS